MERIFDTLTDEQRRAIQGRYVPIFAQRDSIAARVYAALNIEEGFTDRDKNAIFHFLSRLTETLIDRNLISQDDLDKILTETSFSSLGYPTDKELEASKSPRLGTR